MSTRSSHRSPAKKARSLLRLSQFLVRKLKQGIKLNVNIFELMMNVRDLNEKTKESIEDQFVTVTATFDESKVQWQEALEDLKCTLNDEIDLKGQRSILSLRICLLTSNKTRFRGFSHRFSVSLIMPNMANECIKSLCRESFYFYQGSKLFFQFDKG